MTPDFISFETRAAQADALAVCVAAKLAAAMPERGDARLVVPGGSTPVAFFEALAEIEMPWWRVHVSLTDDRQVPPDHPASNVLLVRAHLLKAKAAQAIFDDLETAAHSAPDVLVIGMGEDGHMASLFPGAPELPAALKMDSSDRLVHIIPDPLPPHAPFPRLSMTFSAMMQAQAIYVLLCGRTKLAVYEQALSANPLDMPIAAVLQQTKVPVAIYWAP
jgi:6-phosphogluconolactonase